MRKYLFALLVLVAAGTTLLVAAFATAGGGSHEISAKDGLGGYQEVGAISTVGGGSFEAKVSNDDSSFEWTLSYSGLEGTVTQAHIHFAQRSVNGPIVIWLCKTAATAANAPPGTADCPTPGGTLSGTADAGDVVGPATGPGQGIETGAFGEVLDAIRAGKAYANVHSTKWGGGEIRGQLNDPDGK
jgi:CHRD domain